MKEYFFFIQYKILTTVQMSMYKGCDLNYVKGSGKMKIVIYILMALPPPPTSSLTALGILNNKDESSIGAV